MNASTDSMLLNESGLSTLLQNSDKDTDVSALSQASSSVPDITFKSIPSDSFNDSLTSNLSNSLIENQTPPCPPILLSSSTPVKEVKQCKKYWEKSTSVNFTGNYHIENKYLAKLLSDEDFEKFVTVLHQDNQLPEFQNVVKSITNGSLPTDNIAWKSCLYRGAWANCKSTSSL